MYVGKAPWHKLGTRLDGPATAADAIRAAGLNWQVIKQPLYAGRDVHRLLPGYFAVVRDDHWQKAQTNVLGVVGQEYTPLQNSDAFAFFDPIVGEKAAVYHTAGALGQGERIWLLAKLPEDIRVVGDDIAEKYLLLSNSHDGKSSVQLKFTPIRVVCENTLTIALRGGPTLRAAHTKALPRRLDLARHLLGLVNKQFLHIEEKFKRMAAVQMDSARIQQYFKRVFPDPTRGADSDRYAKALQQAQYDRASAEFFFVHGSGSELDGVAGTLWAAYNGVAEFIDRPLGISKAKTEATITKAYDRKLKDMWFGEGYSTKARAFTVATQFCGEGVETLGPGRP
jgi:phage/plasmid-like protein (TIGR03299 family)